MVRTKTKTIPPIITWVSRSNRHSDKQPAARSKSRDSAPCVDQAGRTTLRSPCRNPRDPRWRRCGRNSRWRRGRAGLVPRCRCLGCRAALTLRRTVSSSTPHPLHSSCWQLERLTNSSAETAGNTQQDNSQLTCTVCKLTDLHAYVQNNSNNSNNHHNVYGAVNMALP